MEPVVFYEDGTFSLEDAWLKQLAPNEWSVWSLLQDGSTVLVAKEFSKKELASTWLKDKKGECAKL